MSRTSYSDCSASPLIEREASFAGLVEPVTSDAELLQRFLDSRGEQAFADLVTRFGPLVYTVARRRVRDRHSAEDVFQATFLVLAQQAGKVRRSDSLAAWLHGVAIRLARKELARKSRQLPGGASARLPADVSAPAPPVNVPDEQILDDELHKLPEIYRTPLVLHYLEGKSTGETAAALGTSEGSVRGRLQRGRLELKQRLMRRGVEVSAVLAAASAVSRTSAAAIEQPLIATTVQGGMAMARGATFALACSAEAVHLATQEAVMLSTILTTGKVLTCTLAMTATTTLGWYGHAGAVAMQGQWGQAPVAETLAAEQSGLTDDFTIVDPELFDNETMLVYFDDEQKPAEGKPVLTLKYDDGKPDGKKSIAGTGEAIRFKLPDKSQKLRSLRIHCARYGTPQAPAEDAEISIVSEDGAEVVHTEMVPYAKFKRGESQWTTIQFEEPVETPETFWVILQFNAEATKGVYVSFDTSTGGANSKTGVPGGEFKDVNTGGDWMVQAILSKPE